MKYSTIKRILDLFFIVLASPLLIVIVIIVSLVIKIENNYEPIFFIQERMGKYNKPFNLYKFRTMNSKNNTYNTWTAKGDIRISRIGKILRKTRIDEIPQFYNVLKNDMSIIGPRPEQTHLANELAERYGKIFLERHNVLPGITGYAQVEYGYVGDFESWKKKLEYDLYYIKNIGLLMDTKIFFQTFIVLIKMFGSR